MKQFAKYLKRLVRQYDILVRFGGEEFVVICPGIDRATTLTLAQRILDSVYFRNFGNDEHSIKLKLSVAIASFPEDNINSGMDLINIVDKILNKVMISVSALESNLIFNGSIPFGTSLVCVAKKS